MVLPKSDPEFITKKLKKTEQLICYNCGTQAPLDVRIENSTAKCRNCHQSEWEFAVEGVL